MGTWTWDEISADWLVGGQLALSPGEIVAAFNKVQSVFRTSVDRGFTDLFRRPTPWDKPHAVHRHRLHKRFREGEVAVFKKNGVDVLAVWQNLDDPNTLVYLLAYKDRAAREAGWAAFGADPEWNKLRVKYFVPLNSKITFMSATDYSPLK